MALKGTAVLVFSKIVFGYYQERCVFIMCKLCKDMAFHETVMVWCIASQGLLSFFHVGNDFELDFGCAGLWLCKAMDCFKENYTVDFSSLVFSLI